ncbi:sugar-transfer associated ATP-grasp domain-containing protein [Phascolarctobacterium sp.]|uniref:sugar-transfer associated ATP-grasp domain-containing protein n=1 Tax=Phascolarctobacterium sp. TaxID=2049039 RepID=UPI00386E0C5C
MKLMYENVHNLKFFDKIRLQVMKWLENRAEEKIIERKFEMWRSEQKAFLLPDDTALTFEQRKQIESFWKRYEFAYPNICFDEFQAFMNRTGVFDPRYIPNGIRAIYIAPYFQHKHYYWSSQNKTLLNKIFPNIKQPEVLVRRMNGYFFDGEYNRINLPLAIEKCLAHLNSGNEFIFKPNDVSGGGRGICFYKNATEQQLQKLLLNSGQSFVIQNVIKQHEVMAKLNSNSVNTLRITSIIWKNKVNILAAAVRIGAGEKRVDNWSAGGMIVGLDDKGHLYPFGLDKKCNRMTMTVGGVDLTKGYSIPCWDKVIETVERSHFHIPYIKLASWDIAIDECGDPILIEVNFAGDWHVHQLTVGPVLGELTQEILDEVILKRYCKKHNTLNFDFKEYHDHIEVEKYLGDNKVVKIPEKMYGKPVTVIGRRAFRFNRVVECVKLPHTVKSIGERAFSGCTSLRNININKNISIHKTAFNLCPLSRK